MSVRVRKGTFTVTHAVDAAASVERPSSTSIVREGRSRRSPRRHLDVEADPAIKGTSFTLYVVLQDFNATNGGTHFVPWDEDYIVSPDLPAGSVILYDSVGLYHRAGDHVLPCAEIKTLRRVRAESSHRPQRHRRDACSMAWRCRFLTARRSQRGHVIAEK